MNSDILSLLNTNPQAGMTFLMERYTGLVWKIVSFHLSNPEDIKECVNDTFTEFYLCRNHFDIAKSDIPTFLAAISRNLSIAKYRKESIRQSEPLTDSFAVEDSLLVTAESRADLAKAIACLKEDEQQIILMKYYDGMTIQEIAASLSLPYETVKKRHQRSLGKLKHMLLCMLIIMLLALITACTYKVLQFFEIVPSQLHKFSIDISVEITHKIPEKQKEISQKVREHLENSNMISDETADSDFISSADTLGSSLSPDDYAYIPGYGINEDSSVPVYKLYQSTTAENDSIVLTLNDVSYMNDVLRIEIAAHKKDGSSLPIGTFYSLYYNDTKITSTDFYSTCFSVDESTEKHELQYYDPDFISYIDEGIEFKVELYNITLSFTLVPSDAQSLDTQYYQLEEYGGVMAVPRLENGSLIITIYPLNYGDYTILPALIRGFYGENEGGEIYVTNSDGTKLTGTCVRYRPYNFVPYFEWNFGKANAGQYTLHIPYLYQSTDLPDDFNIPIDLQNLTWNEDGISIPGGKITVENCVLLDPEPGELIGNSQMFYDGNNLIGYWQLTLRCHSTSNEHTLLNLKLISACELLPDVQLSELGEGEARISLSSKNLDTLTEILEPVAIVSRKAYDLSTFSLVPSKGSISYDDTVLYRWNQRFDLPFTVEETVTEN